MNETLLRTLKTACSEAEILDALARLVYKVHDDGPDRLGLRDDADAKALAYAKMIWSATVPPAERKLRRCPHSSTFAPPEAAGAQTTPIPTSWCRRSRTRDSHIDSGRKRGPLPSGPCLEYVPVLVPCIAIAYAPALAPSNFCGVRRKVDPSRAGGRVPA